MVGVESIVEEIESLLAVESKDVYCLGIWGIGGIGKTTIARAIFDKISSDFEGSCFLENVREESQDQEESLIESLDWLTPVCRIIITTRNKQVLRNWGVRKIYEMEALEYHHALELFSRHAFKQNHPDELSSKAVKYAQGVPLALKVLGCFLYKMEKEVWDSAINKLQRIHHPSILQILKISYDGLDDKEKNIFLDVACFFQGEDVNPVMKFLNASGFYPEIGISVLVDKSLIVISNNNKITMHDWLQELGRDIVSQESIDPGNRSRLWHHEDIYKVLTYNTVSNLLWVITLEYSSIYKLDMDIFINSRIDESRINSRVTMIRKNNSGYKCRDNLYNSLENKCKVSYLEDPRFTEVKYLHWHGYPLKSMPSNICAEQLVFLEVPNSSIEQLWDGMKQHRGKLNQIIHATCKMLIAKTPNPTLIPHLNKLVILNLRGSKSLKSLPAGIFNLEFLTTLDLSGCPKLKRLPEISSSNTSCLFLSGTAIEELPSSIELLLRLEYLDLSDCKRLKSLPSSLCKLKSLEILDLSGCSNLQRLPECLGQLSSLGTLLLEKPILREYQKASSKFLC
ncbi:hypothetical protein CISIN_1g008394mg [Citrus sinensis]|uniref:Uncharacterized protein n=1 Tax=Citrus sinensis TaxID=2711 RepID=A0A067DFK6_CITSI|nr:hypothetical protein CISIN_1g008394mg [Citrus sinensis]